jgi:hypothetical protein
MAEFEKEVEKETTLEPQVTETPEKETEATSTQRADTVLSWLGKFLKMINKYGAKRILEGMLFIILMVFVGLFAFKPEVVFKSYEDYREKSHNERMDKRSNNTPIIQAELDKLRILTDASLVSVWELHNSTNNLDGMPFIFASLTYESTNPALAPIGEQFDNVRLSLYPLSTYLRENEMWYGDVESLKNVDNTAYYRAKALGAKYLGFRLMEVDGAPNAVLSFAYIEGAEVPDNDTLIQNWILTSYKINGLLTVTTK